MGNFVCLFTSCCFVVVVFSISTTKESRTFRDTGKYLDPQRRIQNVCGSRISVNGVHMYKGVGVRFAEFISFPLKAHENEIIWSRGDQIISFS